MARRYPLVLRQDDEVIAFHEGSSVSVERFRTQVSTLARRLPPKPYAINVCQDRYRFLVAFCAIVARGQTNLLPANRQPLTLQETASRTEGSYFVADAPCAEVPDPVAVDLAAAGDDEIELFVDDEHLCAVAYTSGSTGSSIAIPKYWRTIRESTAINRAAYFGEIQDRINIVATVPPQHMYGLETTIMLPLCSEAAVDASCPLLPGDVAAALARIPAPRALISTPAHLKALVAAAVDFPPTQMVCSATASLDGALARAVEARFHGPLREIYGCSEAGSLARRETARNPWWEPFSGFNLRFLDDEVIAEAAHLPEPVTLQDNLQLGPDGRFQISGRKGDIVNVAGKRGSLAALNARLLGIEGVEDGVIFEPSPESQRLAGLVVAPRRTAAELRSELRKYFDPVFLPRPLLFVRDLPRNATGKLPRTELLRAFDAARCT